MLAGFFFSAWGISIQYEKESHRTNLSVPFCIGGIVNCVQNLHPRRLMFSNIILYVVNKNVAEYFHVLVWLMNNRRY